MFRLISLSSFVFFCALCTGVCLMSCRSNTSLEPSGTGLNTEISSVVHAHPENADTNPETTSEAKADKENMNLPDLQKYLNGLNDSTPEDAWLHSALQAWVLEQYKREDFVVRSAGTEDWARLTLLNTQKQSAELRDAPPMQNSTMLVHVPTKTPVSRGDWDTAKPLFVMLATQALAASDDLRPQILKQMTINASVVELGENRVFVKQTQGFMGMGMGAPRQEPEELSSIEADEHGWKFTFFLKLDNGMSAPEAQEMILTFSDDHLECKTIRRMSAYQFEQNGYTFDK